MNAPIAKCTFELTQPLFMEGVLCTHRKNLGKILKWAVPLLAVCWAIIAFFTVSASGNFGFALVELGVIAAVFGYSALWLPRTKAKRAWNAMQDKNTERSVLFYEDHLQMDLPGRQMEVDYGEISETIQSKNLLILVARNRTGIMIKKDELVGGGCDEILRAIKENGGIAQ